MSLQALETQIALTECEDETGKAKKEQLMIGASELAELVGAQPALLLLRAHGARQIKLKQAWSCAAKRLTTGSLLARIASRASNEKQSDDPFDA